MKNISIMFVLMCLSATLSLYAGDVKPVREGNTIAGHVIEKGTFQLLSKIDYLLVYYSNQISF